MLGRMNAHIQQAIAVAWGTQKALAARCGVTQAAVSLWLLGSRVSAENAMAIERATAGAVKARDIRPDVFDPPPAPAPAGEPPHQEAA